MATTPTSTNRAPRAKKTAVSSSGATGTFVCPECGREFERAAALGAHRNRVHGVPGSSSSAKTAASGARRGASRTSDNGGVTAVNRDALLAALFPNGVPPRESVIREVAQWLDQAERLAKQR